MQIPKLTLDCLVLRVVGLGVASVRESRPGAVGPAEMPPVANLPVLLALRCENRGPAEMPPDRGASIIAGFVGVSAREWRLGARAGELGRKASTRLQRLGSIADFAALKLLANRDFANEEAATHFCAWLNAQ